MKFIKRFMAVILTISLFAVSVAGCASSKEQASDMLTREEWIAMLMEAYHMDECYNTTPVFADVSTQSEYFVQIQSCAEWEIVDKTSRFYPELTATNLFAIVTAVRAVGLDKVEKTKDAPSLESAEEIADYFLQQTNMKLDMSDDLTAKTAQQILDASLELAAGLVLEQYHDLQYQDGVLEISENDIAIDYEKQTAELHGIQAEAGTVIVVSPSATLPDGLMAKVTSVDGTRISFENAEMEEVIDSLLLYGTYAPEILRVTPLTDGVTAEYGEEASASAAETLSAYTVPKTQTLGLSGSAPSVQSMLKKEIEVEDAVLKLDKKLEENGAQVRINGSVGIKDILVTAELDCSLMKFNKASLQVDSTIAADISVSAKLDRTFKLAKIECRLWKVVGVDFIVSLHIDLNGNISVEFSVENCEGVSYKPDAKPKCFAKFQKPELEAQVQVQASAEPSITAELVIGPWSVTNIGAEVDLNAEAKVLSTEDGLICTDVKMYVLVSAFVGREAQNGDETLLAKFGVQKNWDIWTKDNTKMKKAWHVENGQVVPACTRETSSTAEKENETENNTSSTQLNIDSQIEMILTNTANATIAGNLWVDGNAFRYYNNRLYFVRCEKDISKAISYIELSDGSFHDFYNLQPADERIMFCADGVVLTRNSSSVEVLKLYSTGKEVIVRDEIQPNSASLIEVYDNNMYLIDSSNNLYMASIGSKNYLHNSIVDGPEVNLDIEDCYVINGQVYMLACKYSQEPGSSVINVLGYHFYRIDDASQASLVCDAAQGVWFDEDHIYCITDSVNGIDIGMHAISDIWNHADYYPSAYHEVNYNAGMMGCDLDVVLENKIYFSSYFGDADTVEITRYCFDATTNKCTEYFSISN